MSAAPTGKRVFGHDRPSRKPDYARVVRLLSRADLLDELAGTRGDPGYRQALEAEAEKRGLR